MHIAFVLSFYTANIESYATSMETLPSAHEVSVSQPPGRGPVLGPGIKYTGPREVLLEFVILVF